LLLGYYSINIVIAVIVVGLFLMPLLLLALIIIIIIIIIMTMTIMLSSWQAIARVHSVHAMNTETAPSGHSPTTGLSKPGPPM